MVEIIVDLVKAFFTKPDLTWQSVWFAGLAAGIAAVVMHWLRDRLDLAWHWILLIGLTIVGAMVFYPYGWHIAMDHHPWDYYGDVPLSELIQLEMPPTVAQMWQQITVRIVTVVLLAVGYLWIRIRRDF